MKRRGFLNLAFLLPLVGSVKSIFKEDELLHFDMAELEPLLKNISEADKVKANLLRKNLLFDVQYVLDRIKDPKDLEAIKILAQEADRKFYAENKMTARKFAYQPINISALEGFRNTTTADAREFEGMMKDIRTQLNSLQTSKEPFVRDVINKLNGVGAPKFDRMPATGDKSDTEAAKKAAEAQKCARTWAMVGMIISLVIVIIVAIIVIVFSYGATTPSPILIQTVIGILAAAQTSSQVISITKNSIRIDNTTIGLNNTKVDLSKVNMDSLLKCSTSAASVMTSMSYFGKSTYPANPLVGSLTVSLIGIVGKLKGFDACS